MEAMKAMIHDQDLPMHLWTKADRTAVYVQKRIAHRALGNKNQEEMFTGEKLEVIHLKMFGCPVFIHVPKEKRTKLDPSRNKGIFIGYNYQLKYYRVYIIGHLHIDISRDVIFGEDVDFKKPRKNHTDEDQEEEEANPRVEETCRMPIRNVEEEHIPKYHDMVEPQRAMEIHQEMISQKRRTTWDCDVIQGAEKYGAP